MKAVVCNQYGPPEVLKIVDLDKPKPTDNEILVKIKATAVNSADVRIRGLKVSGFLRLIMRIVLGFTKPRKQILGSVMSGVVVEVGKNVNLFRPGDEIFGMTGLKMGCYAQYICVKQDSNVALKPQKASFEEAAAILFGGSTAIYFLNKTKIIVKPHLEVLIYGATGSVGTAALQIAKFYQASVTAVCNTGAIELVKSLGADTILDYTRQDFTQETKKFDVIFDCVGKIEKKMCQHLLTSNGKYITVDGLDTAHANKEHLIFLKSLFDDNKLKAVIDKHFTLNDIVAAHKYVDKRIKKGNVVVIV